MKEIELPSDITSRITSVSITATPSRMTKLPTINKDEKDKQPEKEHMSHVIVFTLDNDSTCIGILTLYPDEIMFEVCIGNHKVIKLSLSYFYILRHTNISMHRLWTTQKWQHQQSLLELWKVFALHTIAHEYSLGQIMAKSSHFVFPSSRMATWSFYAATIQDSWNLILVSWIGNIHCSLVLTCHLVPIVLLSSLRAGSQITIAVAQNAVRSKGWESDGSLVFLVRYVHLLLH